MQVGLGGPGQDIKQAAKEVRHHPNCRGTRVGAGGTVQKRATLRLSPAQPAIPAHPKLAIWSQPGPGVRLLGRASTGGGGGGAWASPISSQQDRGEVPPVTPVDGARLRTAAAENAVFAVPVNAPFRSHTHRATPRVVRQPSETVLYREFPTPSRKRGGVLVDGVVGGAVGDEVRRIPAEMGAFLKRGTSFSCISVCEIATGARSRTVEFSWWPIQASELSR